MVRGRQTERLLAVAGAAGASLLVWLVATAGFGLELSQPGFGSQAPQALSLWWVVAIAAIAGLAASGVLTLIERLTRRAPVVWLAVSLVVLVISLGGPMSGEGIDGGNRLALAAMHLAAGAVLIPLFYRSAQRRMEVN
jgi:hypothetical protein